MLRFASIAFAAALTAGVTATTAVLAADIAGSADHPLIGRYQGAEITSYQAKAYEETRLPLAAIARGQENDPAAYATVAGALTSIRYTGPDGRSALEVVRNYQIALEQAGFTTLFACRQQTCGSAASFWEAARGEIGLTTAWDTNTYVLMRLERAGAGPVWVSVFGVERAATSTTPITPIIALRVVEAQALETGAISVVNAGEMAQAIGVDGRVALYGITFDFDSAAVRAESAPQIEQIAQYLVQNPAATVLVVGHTDATGRFDYNRGLSEQRAAAVVALLRDRHGIAPQRLFPVGVGPASPVATNRSEDGRARNRRVEIVEMPAVN